MKVVLILRAKFVSLFDVLLIYLDVVQILFMVFLIKNDFGDVFLVIFSDSRQRCIFFRLSSAFI